MHRVLVSNYDIKRILWHISQYIVVSKIAAVETHYTRHSLVLGRLKSEKD